MTLGGRRPSRRESVFLLAVQLVLEVELCFFVVQHNVLMPNDFSVLTRLRDRLLCFREHYEQAA